jgi:hypothetical protein
MKRLLFAVLFVTYFTSASALEFVGTDMISGTVSTVKNGTIFKTMSGLLFQVNDYVYLYPYVYYPEVLVFREGNVYILKIDGIKEKLSCSLLSDQQNQFKTSIAISTKIDNDFEGYDYENIYKLRNGQIWQQIDFKYRYRYKYAPNVIIYMKDNRYYMQVEGMDDSVMVERLK